MGEKGIGEIVLIVYMFGIQDEQFLSSIPHILSIKLIIPPPFAPI